MKSKKILKIEALKRKISLCREEKKRIVFTNGCFDVLHYGHVSYLEKAKKANRILIVGLNSDKSVRKIKGPKRPINSQDMRAGVLAALQCVDFVILFDRETPMELIKTIKPEIYAKGADWKNKDVVGSDFIKSYGGKIEFIEFIKGLSSSQMIDSIVALYG